MLKCNSVLVLSPHTDDETLGCGGLISKLRDTAIVTVALFSHGGAGIKWKNGEYLEYSNRARLLEFETACSCLGVKNTRYFLDPSVKDSIHHKMDVLPQGDLIAFIEKCMLEFTPDLILSPFPAYDQDHVAVNSAMMAAARPHFYAGSVLQYFVGSEPMQTPNFFVRLDKADLECKKSAFSCYATQNVGSTHALSVEHLVESTSITGRKCNSAFAEGFVASRLVT